MIVGKEGFAFRFFAGIFMGLAMIIPGVSGGVIGIILGLYHQILAIVAHPLDNFKDNLGFMLPLILGGAISVLLFSNLINFLIVSYPFFIMYLFIGLVLGSFPTLIRISNREGFDRLYLVTFLIALMITLLPAFFNHQGPNWDLRPLSFKVLVISGIILAVGTMVPGISSSFLLMMFGTYRHLLSAVAKMNLTVLVPVGTVFLLSALIVSRVTNYLFKEFYGWTYYALLGVLAGSVILVFPGFPESFSQGVLGALLLLAGGIITLNLQED